MARTWLSVTVELLGGRALNCGRGPGRVFAVGPSHTFLQFADAINDAFARWDRSHVSMFTLADGRTVTDDETGAELAASIGGPLTVPIDMARVKVARLVEPGAEFQFTFDLGDGWTHRCVVEEEKVDPLEVLVSALPLRCRTGVGGASRISMVGDGRTTMGAVRRPGGRPDPTR